MSEHENLEPIHEHTYRVVSMSRPGRMRCVCGARLAVEVDDSLGGSDVTWAHTRDRGVGE